MENKEERYLKSIEALIKHQEMLLETLQKLVENNSKIPYYIYPTTYTPNFSLCSCNGTVPCNSIACPYRIQPTYTTSTDGPQCQ